MLASSETFAALPPDDRSRDLAVARPNQDQSLPHIGLVGDTYTIVVPGEATAGRFTVIDMHVRPGDWVAGFVSPVFRMTVRERDHKNHDQNADFAPMHLTASKRL
jgi:hypothetical protein